MSPRLALLLLSYTSLSRAGLFQQPSVSLCTGSDCSSNCQSSTSSDSCSAVSLGLFQSVYAAATCSEIGTLSLKLCSDKDCKTCVGASGGGCNAVDLGFAKISVKASCALTTLAIAVIVISVLLALLCLCRWCCCDCTDANATDAITVVEESTPLVSRRELELRGKIVASQRKLVEIEQRVKAFEARQARKALFNREHTGKRFLEEDEDADIPNVPLSPAELASASATPRFQASGSEPYVEYWPQLDEPEPSGPLTLGSFRRPFEAGHG